MNNTTLIVIAAAVLFVIATKSKKTATAAASANSAVPVNTGNSTQAAIDAAQASLITDAAGTLSSYITGN